LFGLGRSLCAPTWAATAWAATATALAPLLTPHLRARARAGKEDPTRLHERKGIAPTPRPDGRLIWLHAASVGETVSILPVLTELAPHAQVLVTTGTLTSANLLDRRLAEMDLVPRVFHQFAPLDVPAWAARFLDHWRPDAAVFVESELWPNLLRACQRRRIPMMLLNARLSAGSFRAWRFVPGFARQVLGAFDTVWARGEEDAARLRALGVTGVMIEGDLKFAAPPLPCDEAELARLRALIDGRPIWLAASTHPGEEAAIAALHPGLAQRHPGLTTIIVPRHPERGSALAAELGAPRRSAGAPPAPGLWLADTLGEMGLWYRLAPVAFVGRSLFAPGGGQNPIEPARLACAIAVGPHTGNFQEHVALLRAADAIARVTDPAALADFVSAMLVHPETAHAMGCRAVSVAEGHGGLPRRAAERILTLAGAAH